MMVLFALSIHRTEDERVFFQQMETLNRHGFQTSVVSLIDDGLMDGTFSLKQKLAHLIEVFKRKNPSIIVGDSPIVILAAFRYKKCYASDVRLVYDVTEWIPSKKNMTNCSLFLRPFKWIALSLFSCLAGFLTTAFIFGEHHKALPFHLVFPSKKHLYLSYYATFNKLKRFPIRQNNAEWKLCYSGSLTNEKGFNKVLSVITQVAQIRPNHSFVFKLFSSEKPAIEHLLPSNIKLDWCGYLSFTDFCSTIGDADIYFDLRKIDFENTRCLPIKLFYYMAAGRVVIYSDLKAIPIGVPEIEKFGVLVNPSDEKQVVEALLKYIDREDFYVEHCHNAEFLARNKYDWSKIEDSFVDFINKVRNE